MIIGIKDIFKFAGISIVVCCAAFVCTMFLNYNLDLNAVGGLIEGEEALALFDAVTMMGVAISCISGLCLVATSVVMLVFFIKNYIDTHGKELGILKAIGYSNFKIARNFWVFGLSVLVGGLLGYLAAFCYLPTFYKLQNAEQLFPDFGVSFHPILALLLIVLPAIIFAVLSVLYAMLKLKRPVLDLIREKSDRKIKTSKKEGKEKPFLKELKSNTLKSRKTLVFFVAFSAFCFSTMVQMSMSMNDLASENFVAIILIIGLVLALTTMILSLSSVVKGNVKTVSLMRVFGYDEASCSRAVLWGYRPFAYLGFAVGTLYQYLILKIIVTTLFSDLSSGIVYKFDWIAFVITLAAFVVTYELFMFVYSQLMKKMSIKSVFLD